MLLVTSFFGSVIGFYVCYIVVAHAHSFNHAYKMRVCMVNSMSLAFIFAMLVELTTGSKSLAVVVPVLTVCIPVVVMMGPPRILDIAEVCIGTLMSVGMSVMLIGMTDTIVIWLMQCILVLIEVMLCLTVVGRFKLR